MDVRGGFMPPPRPLRPGFPPRGRGLLVMPRPPGMMRGAPLPFPRRGMMPPGRPPRMGPMMMPRPPFPPPRGMPRPPMMPLRPLVPDKSETVFAANGTAKGGKVEKDGNDTKVNATAGANITNTNRVTKTFVQNNNNKSVRPNRPTTQTNEQLQPSQPSVVKTTQPQNNLRNRNKDFVNKNRRPFNSNLSHQGGQPMRPPPQQLMQHPQQAPIQQHQSLQNSPNGPPMQPPPFQGNVPPHMNQFPMPNNMNAMQNFMGGGMQMPAPHQFPRGGRGDMTHGNRGNVPTMGSGPLSNTPPMTHGPGSGPPPLRGIASIPARGPPGPYSSGGPAPSSYGGGGPLSAGPPHMPLKRSGPPAAPPPLMHPKRIRYDQPPAPPSSNGCGYAPYQQQPLPQQQQSHPSVQQQLPPPTLQQSSYPSYETAQTTDMYGTTSSANINVTPHQTYTDYSDSSYQVTPSQTSTSYNNQYSSSYSNAYPATTTRYDQSNDYSQVAPVQSNTVDQYGYAKTDDSYAYSNTSYATSQTGYEDYSTSYTDQSGYGAPPQDSSYGQNMGTYSSYSY